MTEYDRNTAGVQALQRMIAYVRDEARRLHVMDVAILLEHAEEAVVAFALPALVERGLGHRRDRTVPDH